MKSIEIKGTVRTDVGKKATHELRKNNGVPCVLYGVQKDENGLPVATHFSVPTEGLRNLVYILPTGRRIFISGLQKMTVKMIVFDNKINSYCKVAGGFLNIPVLE